MAVVWCRVTRSVMCVMNYALVTWHCHGRLGPLHQIKTLRQALRHSHLTIIIKSMAGMYSEPFHFSMWYMSDNQMFISILKLVHDPRNCPLCWQHALTMSLTGQNYNHPSSVSAMRLWSSCVQRMSTQLRSANMWLYQQLDTHNHTMGGNSKYSCAHLSNQYMLILSCLGLTVSSSRRLTQTRSEKRSHVQYFDWDLWFVWTLTSHHNKTDSWTASHKCSYDSNFTALVLTPLDPPPPSPTAAPLTTTANNYGQNNNKVHILQPQQIFLTLQIFLRVSPV